MDAKHGEFYFTKFVLSNGTVRKAPVFVISNDNDKLDVIICQCTGQPPRTEYDINVSEKYNKIIYKIAKAIKLPFRE